MWNYKWLDFNNLYARYTFQITTYMYYTVNRHHGNIIVRAWLHGAFLTPGLNSALLNGLKILHEQFQPQVEICKSIK